MSFEQSLRELRRLTILRSLYDQRGYSANATLLLVYLQRLGIVTSRDDLITDLHWLRDQDLVRLPESIPGVVVAELTSSGEDVATGRRMVPGVQRPSAR